LICPVTPLWASTQAASPFKAFSTAFTIWLYGALTTIWVERISAPSWRLTLMPPSVPKCS
jgi:hypothetical protein